MELLTTLDIMSILFFDQTTVITGLLKINIDLRKIYVQTFNNYILRE